MIGKSNILLPIYIKELSYTKRKRKLLDINDFEISSKGVTIILGPNGAGKTLFLKSIHGIINSNYSEIFFSKIALNKKIRLKQSMVFQFPILLKRSVLNNLLFVINQRKILFKKKDILKLLSKVDLLDLANERATFLSGGEKQRLSLARAIITSPKVLFLDEATSNLDPYSIQIIEKIIKEVNENGTKVIAITHDLAQAKRLADDIVFMNKGKVCEYVLANKFFKKPTSKEGQLYINGKLVL